MDEYCFLKIPVSELRKLIKEKIELKLVILTEDQYKEILHTTVRNTVHSTFVEIGWKASSFQSGKIYRTEMIEVIGVRSFNKAVENGNLRVYKNDPTKRNSKVYARRGDWERFLAWNVNRKI
ncbi:MAG: hypothetical protein ACYSR3_14475 [Planctomycetota bacterium]|jgi:hypothetical protein